MPLTHIGIADFGERSYHWHVHVWPCSVGRHLNAALRRIVGIVNLKKKNNNELPLMSSNGTRLTHIGLEHGRRAEKRTNVTHFFICDENVLHT